MAALRFGLRPLGKFAMRQFAGPVRQSLTGKGGQRLLTSGQPNILGERST